MKTPRCLNGKEGCAISEPHRHTPGDPDAVIYPSRYPIPVTDAVLDRALDLACATLFRNGIGKAYAPQQKAAFIAQAERELEAKGKKGKEKT